jgi:hypothetical protein
MNEQEQQAYMNAMNQAQLQADAERIKTAQQEVMMKSQDASMVKEQLDLTEELERIDYLLRGYTTEINQETGEIKWIPPKNNEMVILSEYGVHLVRNTIAWYINKDTLLSNYDEDTIKEKMEDFASDLNDTVFMEYEKVFQYPNFEDCKQELNARIENKTKLRVYAREIMGEKLNEREKEAIKERIIKDVEPIIEKELEKIKQQIMKNKLKRFMLFIRVIQDIVHSTYNRAWNGQERKTLREHIHISETKGGMTMPSHPEAQAGFWNSLFKRGK